MKKYFRPVFIKESVFKWLLRGGAAFLLIAIFILISAVITVRNDVRLIKPDATPFFEDIKGRYISEGDRGKDKIGYWSLHKELPHKIAESFIAIEDHRFYNHIGVDLIAIGRAVINNIFSRRREGGSTIPMQIARMQKPGNRSVWKKLCEILTSIGLTSKYSRQTLLKHYLTIVPQGNRIHGVSYSSRRYFRKPVKDLGWSEAAILAAIAKAPGRMNLFKHTGFRKALKRAAAVLMRLAQTEKISYEEYKEYKSDLANIRAPRKETRPFHSYHLIERLEKVSLSIQRNLQKPTRSTVNIDIQNSLADIASNAMKIFRPGGAGNIAIIAVEAKTGSVKGYIGSEYYFDEEYAGSINYALTPRASGSTLKPFIYALGIMEKKFSPSSVLGDMPFFITHEGGQYLVKNYDSLYMGPMIYRKALANSRNTPAVKIVRSTGLDRIHRFFVDSGIEQSSNPASHYGLGIAIGGLYVTLEDLVAGYGIFSSSGKKYKLHWFEDQITTKSKNIQLISEPVCRQVNLFLSDPASRLPSFKRMGNLEYPFTVAVKTGTSQGFRDAWAVAWSRDYIVGVWIGHPSGFRMKKVSGLSAAGVAKLAMLKLHPGTFKGNDYGSFPPPSGFLPHEICTRSGKLKTSNCSDTITEYFKPGTEPVDRCPVHKIMIVKQNGIIRKIPYSDFPPEYNAWAHKHGFINPTGAKYKIEAKPEIKITSPVHNARLVMDPSTPKQFQTVGLEVTVWPEIKQIIWIIDGKEITPTSYPYSERWQLKKGVHTFQARFPNANIKSNIVKITVKE